MHCSGYISTISDILFTLLFQAECDIMYFVQQKQRHTYMLTEHVIYLMTHNRKEVKKMKKIRNIILSAALIAMLPAVTGNISKVSAATKEDVIAAARAAGFPEVYVQQGINYLEAHPEYTSAQYDYMVSQLGEYSGKTDALIDQYLQMYPDLGGVVPELPSAPQEPVQDFEFELEPEPAVPSEPAQDPSASVPQGEKPAQENNKPAQENKPAENKPAENNKPSGGNTAGTVSDQTPQKNYADMTPEEQKEYRESLSQAEKNQILKDLPKDKQLEIINGLIDASAALGMNVTVDELSKDSINYSIRDDDGKIVDISSVGVIVNDTGIDYTALIIGAAAVILASSAGIAYMAVKQKKNN